jgi:hypothetical protein
MLETQRYDWNSIAAQGSAQSVPQAINDLIAAENVEDAQRAYWRIDNTVVVQGQPLEAALPTVRAVVSGMYGTTKAARPLVLELLVQLASGSNEPSESASCLVRECRRELLYGAGYFLFVLEHGTPEERLHCVDLLGLCVHADKALLPRVQWYFERIRERCPQELRVLIENTLSEISESIEERGT